MSARRREPKPPEPIAGVEIRRRQRRDGEVYYQYLVRWKDPVTAKRLVEICDSAQEALDFKAHLRLLKRRGKVEDLDRGRVLLVEFAQRWLTTWAKSHLARTTLVSYAATYNKHLLPRVGHLQLRQITPAAVDQLKSELADEGIGDPTIRRVLAILQGMLRQAVIWGEIEFNPVREIDKPPARRLKVINALSVEQVEMILAHLEKHASPQSRMLAELLAYAAGRPQDVLALPWTSVGTKRLVYAVKNVDGKILPGAKTGDDKARSVEMLRTVRTDLLAYKTRLAGSGLTDLVVPGADGQPWRSHDYKNWATRKARGRKKADGSYSGRIGPFAQAAAAAGVPNITPYYLRHTYASLRIAEQRLSLQEIADELGHDVDVLAKTYAHVISEYRGQGPINPDELIREARAKIARGDTTTAEEATS